jgi:hypothetical protein
MWRGVWCLTLRVTISFWHFFLLESRHNNILQKKIIEIATTSRASSKKHPRISPQWRHKVRLNFTINNEIKFTEAWHESKWRGPATIDPSEEVKRCTKARDKISITDMTAFHFQQTQNPHTHKEQKGDGWMVGNVKRSWCVCAQNVTNAMSCTKEEISLNKFEAANGAGVCVEERQLLCHQHDMKHQQERKFATK